MAECPEFVIWNPVPPGSKFCAQSSATIGGTASNDYNSGVHIVEPGDSTVDWAKSDLDPGPASLSSLKAGGYGATARLVSEPSGPTVTLRAWIEAPDDTKPFDCTWTNSEAGTEFHASFTIVVSRMNASTASGSDGNVVVQKGAGNGPIRLEVVNGDALEYPSEVLALKFAQQLFGVDLEVVDRLERSGVQVGSRLPAVGTALILNSGHVISATEVLFMGVVPLGKFDYQAIREFAHSVLATLGKERPSLRHLAMTLHGVGFGLDEAEAFRAEIAGLLDAVATHQQPPGLIRVSIVERNFQAAKRLTALLNSILPASLVSDNQSPRDAAPPSLGAARVGLGAVGHDSHQKPHVFVAMPFAEEYADRFHYGIQGAANAAGYLCERADLASFAGDVIAWVKDRIGSAALVVADLTAANPNVYLEVGYAWGRGVNTVLVVALGDELKFDVRTQRCLIFRSIRHLEELLTQELKALNSGAGN